MHVILSYSNNKLKSCVKSKMTFYNKFLAQAYTTAIVQEKLSKMKPNKALGVDNFNSSVLREVASSIASPLCEIFKGSIETGEAPVDWKRANVTPRLCPPCQVREET